MHKITVLQSYIVFDTWRLCPFCMSLYHEMLMKKMRLLILLYCWVYNLNYDSLIQYKWCSVCTSLQQKLWININFVMSHIAWEIYAYLNFGIFINYFEMCDLLYAEAFLFKFHSIPYHWAISIFHSVACKYHSFALKAHLNRVYIDFAGCSIHFIYSKKYVLNF